jgi:hypothetical protein
MEEMINISDYTILSGYLMGRAHTGVLKIDGRIMAQSNLKYMACLHAQVWDGSNWLGKGSRLTSVFFKSG